MVQRQVGQVILVVAAIFEQPRPFLKKKDAKGRLPLPKCHLSLPKGRHPPFRLLWQSLCTVHTDGITI